MEIEYREAIPEDAGLLINIYNASFYYDLHMTVERYPSDDTMPESDKGFIRK